MGIMEMDQVVILIMRIVIQILMVIVTMQILIVILTLIMLVTKVMGIPATIITSKILLITTIKELVSYNKRSKQKENPIS